MNKIAAKLVKVMDACSSVKKNGVNDFHHYKYATSADVLEKVNAALVSCNLASVVSAEVLDTCDVVNNKGNTEHLATVKVYVTLIDAESGESIELSGIGSGQDSGDKAVMKAQVSAIKYAYMTTLAMSTNDDPEADGKTDEGSSGTVPKNTASELTCSSCGADITAGVQRVSVSKYGRALCMKCQKQELRAV